MALVTLLTDFGNSEPFVGVMKGVMLTRHPQLTLVDLSHGLPPQDIGAAAFWLAQSHGVFPAGSVHLCVVDPGVGTERRVLAARAGGHLFVTPDNGALSDVQRLHNEMEVRHWSIQSPGSLSATFHGRDVFAPLAAELAAGLPFESVGPMVTDWVRLPRQTPRQVGKVLHGVVEVVDHFGNLISNLDLSQDNEQPRVRAVRCANVEIAWGKTYSDVSVGELVALRNAWNRVEVAKRDGSAMETLGCGVGAALELEVE